MEGSDLIANASPIVRAMAPSISASIGVLLSGGQARKNLEADWAVVEGMIQAVGLKDFRFRGNAMELEVFTSLGQDEIERLVTNTVAAMLKADSVIDWAMVDLEKFNPEFRHRWVSEVSNISDETLQDLFARLLKGELESPGSVSNDTMSIARDMSKSRAEEFQIFCSAALYDANGTPKVVVGCGSPGRDSLAPYGLSFDVLMRLAHHRLIVNEMDSRLNVSGSPKPIYFATHQGEGRLLESSTETSPRPIKGILFTPAGVELARVVERIAVPEYTVAMFQDLDKQGWVVRPGSMRP